MVYLKSQREIEGIKKACKVISECFLLLENLVKPGVSTGYLNKQVEKLIISHSGYPTFKGYGGFPYATCISVNDTLIHGFPSFKTILKDGDIVSIDIGVTLNGFIGDACRTYLVGNVDPETKKLVEVTKESFFEAAKLIKPGVHLGSISNMIQTYCEKHGYSLTKQYTGHGVGLKLHEDPMIPNVGLKGTGIKLKEGMVLAIEPMVNMGTSKTYTLSDGWTVKTFDHKNCAHYENTLVVTSDGCEILTLEERSSD